MRRMADQLPKMKLKNSAAVGFFRAAGSSMPVESLMGPRSLLAGFPRSPPPRVAKRRGHFVSIAHFPSRLASPPCSRSREPTRNDRACSFLAWLHREPVRYSKQVLHFNFPSLARTLAGYPTEDRHLVQELPSRLPGPMSALVAHLFAKPIKRLARISKAARPFSITGSTDFREDVFLPMRKVYIQIDRKSIRLVLSNLASSSFIVAPPALSANSQSADYRTSLALSGRSGQYHRAACRTYS